MTLKKMCATTLMGTCLSRTYQTYVHLLWYLLHVWMSNRIGILVLTYVGMWRYMYLPEGRPFIASLYAVSRTSTLSQLRWMEHWWWGPGLPSGVGDARKFGSLSTATVKTTKKITWNCLLWSDLSLHTFIYHTAKCVTVFMFIWIKIRANIEKYIVHYTPFPSP